MAQAFKKYILIDHTNNRSVFINSLSELTAWFAGYGINMSTIAVDATPSPRKNFEKSVLAILFLNAVLRPSSFFVFSKGLTLTRMTPFVFVSF